MCVCDVKTAFVVLLFPPLSERCRNSEGVCDGLVWNCSCGSPAVLPPVGVSLPDIIETLTHTGKRDLLPTAFVGAKPSPAPPDPAAPAWTLQDI